MNIHFYTAVSHLIFQKGSKCLSMCLKSTQSSSALPSLTLLPSKLLRLPRLTGGGETSLISPQASLFGDAADTGNILKCITLPCNKGRSTHLPAVSPGQRCTGSGSHCSAALSSAYSAAPGPSAGGTTLPAAAETAGMWTKPGPLSDASGGDRAGDWVRQRREVLQRWLLR